MLPIMTSSTRATVRSTCSCLKNTIENARSVAFLRVCTLVVAASVTTAELMAAELSIPTEVASRTDTVTVSIGFRAQDAALAGLQFDLKYHGSVLVTARAGRSTTDAGKSVSTSALADGGSRFVIAGVNRNVIADGTIITLDIRVGPSKGEYNLEIVNALGADADGQAIPIRVKAGRIIRVRRHSGGA